jgi:hypothetical protein
MAHCEMGKYKKRCSSFEDSYGDFFSFFWELGIVVSITTYIMAHFFQMAPCIEKMINTSSVSLGERILRKFIFFCFE